ncbi:MAG: hypothetical protein QM784_14115 [Polyangiaceae bacterium]
MKKQHRRALWTNNQSARTIDGTVKRRGTSKVAYATRGEAPETEIGMREFFVTPRR